MRNKSETGDIRLWTTVALYSRLSFFCGCVFVGLCIIGFAGNILSVLVYCHKDMRKKSINVLLIGLSIADLCLLLLALPTFAITPFLSGTTNPNVLYFQQVTLAYIYPVGMILKTWSISIFIMITIERYVAVCHPFLALTELTPICAIRALLVTLFVAGSYNLVRFWEFSFVILLNSNNSEPRTTFTLSLRANSYYQFWYGTVVYFMTHFLLPCLFMGIFNHLIIRTIVQARKSRASSTPAQQKEQRISVMMVVVILIFVFCHCLSFLLNLYEALDPAAFASPSHRPLLLFVNTLSNTLVAVNSAITFIVYLTLSNRYRIIAYNMFAWCFKKPQLPILGLSSSNNRTWSRSVSRFNQLSVYSFKSTRSVSNYLIIPSSGVHLGSVPRSTSTCNRLTVCSADASRTISKSNHLSTHSFASISNNNHLTIPSTSYNPSIVSRSKQPSIHSSSSTASGSKFSILDSTRSHSVPGCKHIVICPSMTYVTKSRHPRLQLSRSVNISRTRSLNIPNSRSLDISTTNSPMNTNSHQNHGKDLDQI